MSRLFGTDGVRGIANADLTPELAMKIGRAGATVLGAKADPRAPIVVGRDTRLSGPMLEAAVIAGIMSTGRDVTTLGIIPTPGVAFITRMIEGVAGVMISASHNPIEDNGIKFFGPDGFKLSDEIEDAIERHVDAAGDPRATHEDVGTLTNGGGLQQRYMAQLLEGAARLSGMTVVVDAAFGAAYAIAPAALRALGAEVVELHARNDGRRINVECGATDLAPLKAKVAELAAAGSAAVGVAFDGDADRVMFVDEMAQSLSGDHVMAIMARELKAAGALHGDAVVGTVMSNIGLERAFAREGITLLRAPVGDRYVLEKMREGGYTLGGEQSGHIIDMRKATTGDGPMTAITVLSILARRRERLHDLAQLMHVYPQILVNIETANKGILQTSSAVQAAIRRVEEELAGTGRILVRPSGTEPLIRVMMEGEDQAHIERLAQGVADVIRAEARA